MKQTLKISIVRGGCRFATPLYLGGEYALTFEGERADEAKTLLVTRPQKDRDGNLIALAKSETADDGGVSLFLNRQALVDWFGTCRADDVDATVDAHVYVFDADSVAIADSDVTIEYRPIDFVISDKEFEKWSDHEDRIEVLEDASKSHDAVIADHEEDIAALAKQDEIDLRASAEDATRKANAAIVEAKDYADNIKNSVARMQYVRCDAESTEERKVYHRVSVVKNSLGQHVLAVDEAQASIDGGDPEVGKYVTIDTEQVVTAPKIVSGKLSVQGDAIFSGNVTAVTKKIEDESTNVATTKYVADKAADIASSKVNTAVTTLKKSENTWSGKNTFSSDVTASGSVTASGEVNLSGASKVLVPVGSDAASAVRKDAFDVLQDEFEMLRDVRKVIHLRANTTDTKHTVAILPDYCYKMRLYVWNTNVNNDYNVTLLVNSKTTSYSIPKATASNNYKEVVNTRDIGLQTGDTLEFTITFGASALYTVAPYILLFAYKKGA